jgi:hypothetical protein
VFEGRDERVLHEVQGEIPVAEGPHERSGQPAMLLAKDALERVRS